MKIQALYYDDLTQPERQQLRNLYVQAQDGKCCHCQEPLDGPPAESVSGREITPDLYPPNFFRFSVHLHHNRKTGLTVGEVHNYCNAVLWEHHGE